MEDATHGVRTFGKKIFGEEAFVARAPGAGVGAHCATAEGAKERARVLSRALCPEVVEVADAATHDLVAVFVDGAEYHQSLADLARSSRAVIDLAERFGPRAALRHTEPVPI